MLELPAYNMLYILNNRYLYIVYVCVLCMTLSDSRKIPFDCIPDSKNFYFYPEKKVREFIKELKEEDKDLEEDVIALIEINNYGKQDLIAKMRRLLKAHNEEKDKLAGEKLV